MRSIIIIINLSTNIIKSSAGVINQTLQVRRKSTYSGVKAYKQGHFTGATKMHHSFWEINRFSINQIMDSIQHPQHHQLQQTL
jgi:hypothetical protein